LLSTGVGTSFYVCQPLPTREMVAKQILELSLSLEWKGV